MALTYHGVVHRTAEQVVGYCEQVSLQQDIEQQIVVGLRKKLYEQMHIQQQPKPYTMYLIQQYTDEPWTPETVFTHVVAAEFNSPSTQVEQDSELIMYTLLEGDFYSFVYEGNEVDIDKAYDDLREWFEREGIVDERMYDIESWPGIEHRDQELTRIHMYIPMIKNEHCTEN